MLEKQIMSRIANRLRQFCLIACAAMSGWPVNAASLTFEKDIRPIFREHCLDCHGAEEELKGKLDLRLRRFLMKGGKSGPAIAPGTPEKSLLLQKVREGEMPPSGGPIPSEQIAILEKWIQSGAPTLRPEPENIGPGLGITEEERAFWSFQPIKRPPVPEVANQDQIRTPIDAFILRKLETKGTSFSPTADRVTQMRRAWFDLVGLPPTAIDAQAFAADISEAAYERLIDRLLNSPHYGERWGRHWLDTAGYADSEGHTERDDVRPYAWRYRDYVIRAFNDDKPFDRFILEQLAGDELVPQPHRNLKPDQIELLTATGFLRMAADGTGSGANNSMGQNQVIADTLKIVSTSLLGLSVGCAQCHDHRYDPISQKDYYQLRAIFEPAFNGGGWKTPPSRRVSLYTDADRANAAKVEAEAREAQTKVKKKESEYVAAALEVELKRYEEPLRSQLRDAYKTPAAKRTDEQKGLLKKYPATNISPGTLYQYNQKAADEIKKDYAAVARIRARKPKEEFLRVMFETPGKAPLAKVFHRGDPRQPKDEVQPAGLTVASQPGMRPTFEADDKSVSTSGRRLAYARWLTGRDHPLTARVIVNRVWQHHFGRGLVRTPDDFGALGERPSHPELLDWLADEFMAMGWSLKRLHKLIMMSAVYRQSSVGGKSQFAGDPANLLYSRKPIIRLDAEIVRDRMLVASGAIKPDLFGPAVAVKADAEGQVIEATEPTRRSVYLQNRRSQPLSLLTTFDAPVMVVNCAKRPSSTVTPQSLMMMNSEFVLKQAEKMADRAMREAPSGDRVRTGFDPAALTAGLQPRWEFGYGGYDEMVKRTASFTRLPHWAGSSWRGGPKLPAPVTGHAYLSATGGHPDRNPGFATIRRWIAPKSGAVTISGDLHHPSPNADGVRGRIVSSRGGLLGEWSVKTGTVATAVDSFEVQAGDTIDFITDCRSNYTSDSFQWKAAISLAAPEGDSAEVWKSEEGFRGPFEATTTSFARLPDHIARAWELAYNRAPTREEMNGALEFAAGQLQRLIDHPPADAKRKPESLIMANLCQALLNSNEFLYVD